MLLIGETQFFTALAWAHREYLHPWILVALVAWEFLLRVQNEACLAYISDATIQQWQNPQWHAAIWINEKRKLVRYRLRSRKHRPNGSLLIHKCRGGDLNESLCMFHVLLALLRHLPVGSRVWCLQPHQFQVAFRRALRACGSPR